MDTCPVQSHALLLMQRLVYLTSTPTRYDLPWTIPAQRPVGWLRSQCLLHNRVCFLSFAFDKLASIASQYKKKKTTEYHGLQSSSICKCQYWQYYWLISLAGIIPTSFHGTKSCRSPQHCRVRSMHICIQLSYACLSASTSNYSVVLCLALLEIGAPRTLKQH